MIRTLLSCLLVGPAALQAASGSFAHGVASGDPRADSVILWTRVTPEMDQAVTVDWEIATDSGFANSAGSGQVVTDSTKDYTVKVEAASLTSGTEYYYRFSLDGGTVVSLVGRAKTLPQGPLSQVRFAVFSCANITADYFNPYGKAAEVAVSNPYDAIIHVGDYIYEYGLGGYPQAQDRAEQVGFEPDREIITLADYRLRYAQYHREPSLQQLRASAPLIPIWDDHETANDSWATGAENHATDGSEGTWDNRVSQALQAYYEWMPVREPADNNRRHAYRSFDFGDLVSLHMLETRLTARVQQLTLAPTTEQVTARITEILGDPTLTGQYATTYSLTPPTGPTDAAGIQAFSAALAGIVPNEMVAATVLDAYTGNRDLMGAQQLSWLQAGMTASTNTWQVLGQQVLMGNMTLPAELLLELGAGAVNDATVARYATPVFKQANNIPLTTEEQAVIDNANPLPYNLDAWDGYGKERETILQTALGLSKKLVVFAGDTHNAWANSLLTQSPVNAGTPVGVEFATAGVSAPGIERFFPGQEATLESLFKGYAPGLKFADLMHRGFLDVTFTPSNAEARFFLKKADASANDWTIQSITTTGTDLNIATQTLATDQDDDMDGLPTWLEFVRGTSNALADTDADGLTDLLEVRNTRLGFNPVAQDAANVFMNLHTESEILDLNLGGLLMRNGQAGLSLDFFIESSEDLGASWQNFETITRQITVGRPRTFFRIRAGQTTTAP